jgi:hypothetical protein
VKALFIIDEAQAQLDHAMKVASEGVGQIQGETRDEENRVREELDQMIYFVSPAFFTFSPQNAFFRHNQFSILFFSMKVAESRTIVLVSCIIDFKDIRFNIRVVPNIVYDFDADI